MANTPAQVALDERALLKARNVVKSHDIATIDYALEVGIRAYLSSLSNEAGDDGQGALVERARYFVENPSAWESGFDQGASDRLAEILAAYEALTRENAALRADKERLERERDYAVGKEREVTATIKRVWAALGNPEFETLHGRTISEVVADWKERAEAAERRLAEQGQAQGEAVVELAAQAMYELKPFHGLDNRPDPIPWREYARYNPGLADGLRQQARAALSCATPPSPEPDAELGGEK